MHTVATGNGGSVATQEEPVILHLPIQSQNANTWETALYTTSGPVIISTKLNVVIHLRALKWRNTHMLWVSWSFEYVIESNTIAISIGFDGVWTVIEPIFCTKYWRNIFKLAVGHFVNHLLLRGCMFVFVYTCQILTSGDWNPVKLAMEKNQNTTHPGFFWSMKNYVTQTCHIPKWSWDQDQVNRDTITLWQ